MRPAVRFSRQIDLIVIGCSLGGMHALEAILQSLPADFCVPMAVVQHRHKQSNSALPSFLDRAGNLEVVDVEHGQPIEQRKVYLAPADYHLLVEKGRFSLSVEAAVAFSRPSVDVLFESAADAYGANLAGVVLTGANADGANGVRRIKQRGGFVVAQDPATAQAPAMPQAAISTGGVDRILPLDRIGPFLVELCHLTSAMTRK